MLKAENRSVSRGKRFLSYYKPYRGLLLADLACALTVSAVVLILPLCARHITQNILASDAPDVVGQILTVGLLMIALVLLHTACSVFVDYKGHMMGTLMEANLRRDLFAHYQRLSFRFYDENRTGQLMSRVTNDLFAISELYHHGPEDLLIAALKFSGAFVIMLSINPTLTLIIFAFLPPMAIYALHFNRKLNAALRRSHERIGDVNAQVEDTLSGIRVVQSFTNEALEEAKFAHENNRFVQSREDGYRSEAYFYGGMGAFTQFFTITVILLGGIYIANKALTLPDLLAFLLYIGSLIEPIQRVTNFARLYQEGITGFNRFAEIMEIAPEITDSPTAIAPPIQGGIRFQDVSFRYHEDYDYAIKNISLHIKPGEYVALVGTSGVGKTTLCSLIPRFYEATAGQIFIDEVAIKGIRLDTLRKNVGVVQQDVYLFAGTIAENIGYGKGDATLEEIIAAAKQANAHAFITALPNGYHTDIGQRGIKLSGGQKQRLSIARVFLKNPPIIIFDEATSALDNESEKAVRQSLEKLAERRTMLVIAHRLSTIRNAQRILVLTENGIEQQGTHDSLLAQGGAYATLYNLHLSR
jgi:ATP-binding cassette, subfamily B, bacterial